MKLEITTNRYGHREHICPVCGIGIKMHESYLNGENFGGIKMHLKGKKDKAHQDFVIENSEIIRKRVLNIKFE